MRKWLEVMNGEWSFTDAATSNAWPLAPSGSPPFVVLLLLRANAILFFPGFFFPVTLSASIDLCAETPQNFGDNHVSPITLQETNLTSLRKMPEVFHSLAKLIIHNVAC